MAGLPAHNHPGGLFGSILGGALARPINKFDDNNKSEDERSISPKFYAADIRRSSTPKSDQGM
jgi:hypothetical protein